MASIPSHDELEALFVNNEALDRIAAHLGRFNPIRTMRMEQMEIRHSAILAWLLDPSETHGLADRFLKAFIAEALRGRKNLGRPDALDVSQSDMRDAEVRREWQHIDILVVSRRNGWAFVIENKLNSRQHQGQLTKYAERLRAIFGSGPVALTVRGVFLTLNDEEPEDKTYAPVNYNAIVELLPRLMAIEGQAMGQDVATFLRQYIDILKDATGMSEELKQMATLARQLYRTHRKAIDFIIEHGATTDFSLAVEELFGSNLEYGVVANIAGKDYKYTWHGSNSLSIFPMSWSSALGGYEYYWPGLEDYWAGYPLALWFKLYPGADGNSGTLKLAAEVGPLPNPEGRSALIAGIQALAEREQIRDFKFQSNAAEEGRQYSRFLGRNAVVAVENTSDAAEIADAIKKLLARFGDSFEKLTPAFASIMKYAERV
jgi:hypothetical protein